MKKTVSPSSQPRIWSRWGKLNQRKALASESLFRRLIDRNNAIILQIDAVSGRILDANASACAFYGWTHAQLCALSIQDINQLSPAQVAAELAAALLAQRNYFVFVHRLAYGDLRTVEVHATPMKVGKQTILVSIIHDISQEQAYRAFAQATSSR